MIASLVAVLFVSIAAAPLGAAGDGFVGAEVCAACHQSEFDAWQGSHHDLAMQHVGSESVLGDFKDAEITVGGVTSRFFIRGGKYLVNTDGPDGEMSDFEVAYTFGVYPLQQYLVEFPDGRVQALGLAWDSRQESEGGQRWFHLYPGESIDYNDELHWTGRQQNWNYMCADCHSTNFVKGYEIETNRFKSTWSEINVSCEACHGPGETHVSWAAMDDGLREKDVDRGLQILLRDHDDAGWVMSAETGIAHRSEPPTGDVEVQVCAVCHSRRGTLAGGGQADAEFLNQHLPAFLTETLYFPDGQIEDEVYVWGSFLQSKMHQAGVTCSDCHEPHSLDLRAEGDAVCSQCHLPSKFAVTAHHGHPDTGGAPACVDCHMPERTYMVVDPRRDHSIRVPSPQRSVKFGVPNACNQCHAGKTAEWAASAFARLYPDAKAPSQDWVAAFHQARAGLPQAEVSLLGVSNDQSDPALARATAIVELAPYLSPVSGQALQSALFDPEPLVRLAALRTLEVVPPEHRFSFAKHLLTDSLLAIRSEAGRVLAGTPPQAMSEAERTSLETALEDYAATQRYNGDRPESWLNLGNVAARSGDFIAAEQDYRKAMQLAPEFEGGYLNLADLYRQQGREPEARKALQQGLGKQPASAALNHALGLSSVRSGDQATALEFLSRAVVLDPANARYAYVYGVGLNSAGRTDEAVDVLTSASERHPNDLQIMQAVAIFERDRGNLTLARQWAEKALTVNPADQGARQLLDSLPRQPE